ncbi:hypothetical protein BFT35_08310 [Thermoanaerobacterium thermosaccharolyticum]|uniref:Uncharacterized protein n=1 Tax=Thermoanaerobacterium thermosaccharolyticum TaxID=1517 RepID=A0A223I2E8_THETR|nr:hypothetical protein [Thermoanaerobacterium thermosaccharolyticum]AST58860.1 uncharacterized protein Thert_03086 [Thermoanaerobacterium thermosaccharolyticum]PHO06997.1 hypothetical protein BFT35_08310 [Thermoanaerobacterium thermosaccharolyticum]
MCDDVYEGILEALEYAMLTCQSVNIGLNRRNKAERIEGVVKKVYENSFLIDLEDKSYEYDATFPVSEVEYVEYS